MSSTGNGRLDWPVKVTMIQLGQQGSSKEDREKFQEYVLLHINDFDAQAWDMFLHTVSLMESEIMEDKSFWEKVYPILYNLSTDIRQHIDFSLRAILRYAVLMSILEDDLKLKHAD